MTNQSREAFEKLLERARKIAYPPYPGYSLHIDLNWVEELMEDTWQAALSEGRRLGIEEAAKVVEAMIGASRREIAEAIRALMVKEGKV